jgi:hypothetical protein
MHIAYDGEDHPVIKVSEFLGEPADLLHDQVNGFGAAVADAVARHPNRITPQTADLGV